MSTYSVLAIIAHISTTIITTITNTFHQDSYRPVAAHGGDKVRAETWRIWRQRNEDRIQKKKKLRVGERQRAVTSVTF